MNSTIYNPYQEVILMIKEVKDILIELRKSSDIDYNIKYYTIEEAADILNLSKQTISNYHESGKIKIDKIGPRRKLIHHFQIFNEDNTPKKFKYIRTKKA